MTSTRVKHGACHCEYNHDEVVSHVIKFQHILELMVVSNMINSTNSINSSYYIRNNSLLFP